MQVPPCEIWRPEFEMVGLMRKLVFIPFLSLFGVFASLALAQPDEARQSADAQTRTFKEAARIAGTFTVRIDSVGGLERLGESMLSLGPVTGTIVSSDGYVLSASYNFLGEPSAILVTLPDGRRAPAKIVARDEARMLTLLKVETDSPLPTPVVVPRTQMRVGQWTLAMGRAYEGELPSVSVGVMSAVDRVWGRAIQTDAKISPVNYGGPLVDVQGRALGILVPLSPEGGDALAGSDWYDSGIGFAVPLEDLLPRLPRLQAGETLKPGLIGIAIEGQDIYAPGVKLAAVPPGGPAARAGVKPGDVVVEANGRPVDRQAQLKHIVGALYAGEAVRLVVERDGERLTFDVPLAETIEPYVFASLGALPDASAGDGVALRRVFPGSPLAEAGLAAGDRIVKLDDAAIVTAADLYAALLPYEPGAAAKIAYVRGGNAAEATVTLAALDAAVPADLPPANRSAVAPADGLARGWVEQKLPEDPHVAHAIVPDDYDAAIPHGLVVVLGPPGKAEQAAGEGTWAAFARERDFVVLFLDSEDEKEWNPTEVEVLRKLVDQALTTYSIDRARVAVYGYRSGGQMAYLFAGTHRDLPRGLVVVDGVAPPRTSRPETDPVNRLAVLLARSPDSDAAVTEGMTKNFEILQERKLPSTLIELSAPGAPQGDDRAAIERWLDAIDRF